MIILAVLGFFLVFAFLLFLIWFGIWLCDWPWGEQNKPEWRK